MSDFKYVAGTSELPDGVYFARLDEFEDAEAVVIKKGKAYKDGRHFIMYGFEWKRLDPKPPTEDR